MRKFITITTIIGCLIILFIGRSYWKDKIENATAKANVKVEEHNTQVKEEKVEEEKAEKEAFIQLTKNLPDPTVQKILKAKDTEKTAKILVMGSDLITTPAWKEGFLNQLNEVYGPGIFEFHNISYGKKTSLDVLHNELYKQAVELQPDIVLFEPLLMNDNGKVRTQDTMYTVKWIGDALKEKNPDIAYMIMPTNPIYQPDHYQEQIDELKDIASEEGYTYLDYWQAWPDTDSEEIKEYLSEENKYIPNQKGYETWIGYVVNYLTGK